MSTQNLSSHAKAGEVARTTPVVRDGGGVATSELAVTPSIASRSPSPAKRVRKGAAR
jgi:hypothetical protein